MITLITISVLCISWQENVEFERHSSQEIQELEDIKLYQEIHSAGSGREIASYMPKILLFTHTAYTGIHFIFIHDFVVRAWQLSTLLL
jgi:hypothetical protein